MSQLQHQLRRRTKQQLRCSELHPYSRTLNGSDSCRAAAAALQGPNEDVFLLFLTSVVPLAGAMSGARVAAGVSHRRRDRRYLQLLRHERLAVEIALEESLHNAAPRTDVGPNHGTFPVV